MLRLLILTFTLLTLCIAVVRLGYELAYPLQSVELFNHPECRKICWMGLETDQTSLDEVEAMLTNHEYTQQTNPDAGLVFIVPQHDHIHVELHIDATDMLDRTIFSYDRCQISRLVQLGYPDSILEHDGAITLLYKEGHAYRLYSPYETRNALIVGSIYAWGDPFYDYTWHETLQIAKSSCKTS